jgi:hypothetical protein
MMATAELVSCHSTCAVMLCQQLGVLPASSCTLRRSFVQHHPQNPRPQAAAALPPAPCPHPSPPDSPLMPHLTKLTTSWCVVLRWAAKARQARAMRRLPQSLRSAAWRAAHRGLPPTPMLLPDASRLPALLLGVFTPNRERATPCVLAALLERPAGLRLRLELRRPAAPRVMRPRRWARAAARSAASASLASACAEKGGRGHGQRTAGEARRGHTPTHKQGCSILAGQQGAVCLQATCCWSAPLLCQPIQHMASGTHTVNSAISSRRHFLTSVQVPPAWM